MAARLRVFVTILACGLAACGTEPVIPAAIRLGTTQISFSAIEQTQQLTPTTIDQQGNILKGIAITWQSADETIATVVDGLVRARGAGTTVITASTGGAMATVDIAVVQRTTVLRSISGGSQSALAGDMLPQPLIVEALDANFKPVAGATIEFYAEGGGAFQTPTAVTDASGRAAGILQVHRSGPFEVYAVVAESNPEVWTSFQLSGTTGPVAQVRIAGSTNNRLVRPGEVIGMTALVTDSYGNGVEGIPYRLDVVAGGGTLGYGDPITTYAGVSKAEGLISFAWKIGAEGEQRVTVTTPTLPLEGSPTMLTTFATTGFISPYDINLRFASPITPSQALAFAAAEQRWEQFIVDDLTDISLSLPAVCGEETPGYSGGIDDLMIWVQLLPIDGPGETLASAGPCIIRSENDLPLVGLMYLDSDDVAALESSGKLQDVIMHEMGHILGIGTLWEEKNLLVGPSSKGGTDPHFVGLRAIGAFNAAGGATYTAGLKVPVEASGGPGTADGHWREVVLGTELMTGYLNAGTNPLSAITINSLWDLGYTVNASGADPFSFGQGWRRPSSRQSAWLKDDVRRGPIQRVDGRGRPVGILTSP